MESRIINHIENFISYLLGENNENDREQRVYHKLLHLEGEKLEDWMNKKFKTYIIAKKYNFEFRGDNFFIKKLVKESVALRKGYKEFIYLGNLNVKRDIGYAPDYMHALYLMLKSEIPKDYIIASGKSTELSEIVRYVFLKLNISLNKIKIKEELVRKNEIHDCVGNSTQIKLDLGWNYSKNIYDILDLLIEQELKNRN